MSDERSVEARLLTLLTSSFTANFIDPGEESCWGASAASVPDHIIATLQTSAESAPVREVRCLAQLGIAISKRIGDACFDSLAWEVCMAVCDVLPEPNLMSLHQLTSLLEDIEAFSRNFFCPADQIEEYRRQLENIVENNNHASSTGLEARATNLSAQRLRYPPTPIPITSEPDSTLFSESASGLDIGIFAQIYLLSSFVYHLLLLRLPTTYAALAADSLCLHDGDICELDMWKKFTAILLKQWKTLGLFSTLIFGATLTMFQIPSVLDSPVLRTSAHGALLCVMTSLIHSSFLSVYFGAWQSPGMAASWMREMRGADPHTFWNFWVFIALPTVWTCWGVFLFIASIILFMWPLKYDAGEEPLGTRVFLLLVLSTGALHLALVVSMLRQVSHHHSVSDGMHAV